MKLGSILVRLGIFTVVMSIILVGLVVVFGQVRFKGTTTYQAAFTSASGLEKGQIVRVAGVRVGKVEKVSVGDRSALVTFNVEKPRKLLEGTRAQIRYENLVGDRYLALLDGPGPMEELGSGETIPISQTAPALDLDVLIGGFQPLFEGLSPEKVNRLSESLIATLQGQGGTVNSLLAEAASLTSTLADRDQLIGEVIDNLNTVLGTLNERGDTFSNLVGQLQELVSGLAADRDPIGQAVTKISGLSSSVGGLLTDVRPPLRGSIAELDRTAGLLVEGEPTLDRILQQLPGAYDQLRRAGAYGAFFNFYICSVTLKLTGPDGKPFYTPTFGSPDTPRCNS